MKTIKKQFARQLRKEQTSVEKVIWKFLKSRKFFGHKFRRQHVIEGFIVDFYCHALKLAIELDGGIHERRKEYDARRDEIISSKGITIFRIKNNEIKRSLSKVFERIQAVIVDLQKLDSNPLPLGEGRL